jgi:hypothetical protein
MILIGSALAALNYVVMAVLDVFRPDLAEADAAAQDRLRA